ncbi:hypothetical protein [Enterovirga rhinocerotis]|uniref:Uncharacterized protein n=1 Tax=Enterovirga rhinocerotis TaxID=1339210 RepID=A0A4R7BWL8_9HYPH|nr:hypothetical protein [Enterovirga rhinocerotis]TDR90308.1 hypothetical protein EV668_3156 [Enterovirga rhinocerotis]
MTKAEITTTTTREDAERKMQRQADVLVQREVLVCMSSLVATLAQGFGFINPDGGPVRRELSALAEQAAELASPIADYEEAARNAGWSVIGGDFENMSLASTVDHPEDAVATASPGDACGWEDLCEEFGLDAYESEVFEHWSVTEWLAGKLEEQGEKVDRDFAGLCIWARTTTGQAIGMDGCIRAIVQATDYASAEAAA